MSETLEELRARIAHLEEERSKRLQGELAVAAAKKRVDDELSRMTAIQEFVGEALKIRDADEITEIVLETIVEAFECETAVFLMLEENGQAFSVLASFDGEVYDIPLPCPEKLLSSQESLLLEEEPDFFEQWDSLGLANGMVCSFVNVDSNVVGAVLCGNTAEGLGTYVPLEEQHKSSFSVLVSQATSLRENLLLGKKVEGYVQELEEHKSLLEQRVEERTHEIVAKEAQLRMALENMPGAMIVVDQNLRVTTVNDTYKDFFGDPDSTIQPGASMKDVLKSEIDRGLLGGSGSPEEILEERVRSFKSESIVSFEDRTPDGRYIQLTRTPAPGGFTVTVAIDVTDRKKAEQKLSDAFNVISSSITYASRIQRSILPDRTILDAILDDYFILWEPRDVVGGDIYWAGAWGQGLLIVLGDCTGHGVPGAFMTLISMGALERARSEVEEGNVGALLTRMHQFMQITLSQHIESGESDDGIELGAYFFVPDDSEITFSGARFELLIADGQEVTTVKGTKAGAGYRGIPYDQVYEETKIPHRTGQSYYMTSDGLIDQVGGEKKRMFGKRRFRELLAGLQGQSMHEQKDAIYQALVDYQGEENRRDDVSVIGFKI